MHGSSCLVMVHPQLKANKDIIKYNECKKCECLGIYQLK